MKGIPKVSVIVPVYKAEDYLHQCVDSLLGQTYGDIEVLLVDDGSPDACGKICDAYASKDGRVRVFHKENGGTSSAKNVGIREARGEWIAFVDSDDFVRSSYLENLLACTADGVDLVMGGFEVVSDNNASRFEKFDEMIINGTDHILSYLFGDFDPYRHIFYFCHSKLFKGDVLRKQNIMFDTKYSLGEDRLFVLDMIRATQKMTITSKCEYVIMNRASCANDRLSRKMRSMGEYADSFEAGYKKIMSLYETYGIKNIQRYADDYLIDRSFHFIMIPYSAPGYSVGELSEFVRNRLIGLLKESLQRREHVQDRIVRLLAFMLNSFGVRLTLLACRSYAVLLKIRHA